MFYLLTASSLLLVFPFFYKLKLERVFVLFFLMSFFLFISLNRQNQDYQAYIQIFDNPVGYAEPGFVFMIESVKFLGGTHHSILFILGLLTVFTFARICCLFKFDGYGYFYSFLFFYFLFPFAIDVVQIRNTFAMLIFINSILLVFERRIIFSLFLVFISPLFHFFGLLYVIIWIIFVLGFYRWKYYNYFFTFCVMNSIAMLVFLPKMISFLELDGVRTLSYYISPIIKLHSFIIWGVPLLIDIFVFKLLYRKVRLLKSDDINLYAKNVVNLLCIFALFIPLVLYLDEFNRFFRTVLIVKYIAFMAIAPFLTFNLKLFLFSYIFLFSAIYGVYYFNALGYDYILFGSHY